MFWPTNFLEASPISNHFQFPLRGIGISPSKNTGQPEKKSPIRFFQKMYPFPTKKNQATDAISRIAQKYTIKVVSCALSRIFFHLFKSPTAVGIVHLYTSKSRPWYMTSIRETCCSLNDNSILYYSSSTYNIGCSFPEKNLLKKKLMFIEGNEKVGQKKTLEMQFLWRVFFLTQNSYIFN